MKVVNLDQNGKVNMDLEELDKQAPLGAFSTFDAEILVEEIQKLKSGEKYVEIGVDKGKSLYIAREVALESVDVYGVDIQEDPEINGTIFIQGKSEIVGHDWQSGEIALLFIDGDHSYGGCKLDIQTWLLHMKKGGVILFHDCDESSPGVVWAVAEFYVTHKCENWVLYKRSDKNTSMSKIQL